MDENEHEPIEPETTAVPAVSPSAAMPLSMPPITAPTEATAAADQPLDAPGDVPTVPNPGLGAMPLSMPPVRAADPVTAEYPTATGSGSGGGAIPPTVPSWASEVPWPRRSTVAPPVPRARRRSSRALLVVASASLLAGGLGAGLGAAFTSSGPSDSGSNALTAAPKTPSPAKALSESAIYRLVTPSIVDIDAVLATPEADGTSEESAGTGMIVSSDGLILTNNHVIKSATKISVTIIGRNETLPATVVGTSANNDIALLKVNGVSGLPTVAFADSAGAQLGDTVIAVGNAGGYGGSPSVARRTISALNRTIDAQSDVPVEPNQLPNAGETLKNLIETNAEIEPGDSGGPLLNTNGQVIGMDTAGSADDAGSALGFAIPIDHAKQIALDIEHGTVNKSDGVHVGLSPFLGVYDGGEGFSIGSNGFESCSSTGTATTTGAMLSDVISNSPASSVGLSGGDTITSVNGKRVTSWTVLESVVGALHPGAVVSIGYTDGCHDAHTVSVTLGGIPS